MDPVVGAMRRRATLLRRGGRRSSFYRTETANYRDNLASGAPILWVALRPTGVEPPYEVFAVTADPAEGEAWTEAGNDLVEVVPMPEPVRAMRRGVRRRASCRAAVRQAQARPRRSRGAGAPRADREGARRMSEPEHFSRAGRGASATRRKTPSGTEAAQPRRNRPTRRRTLSTKATCAMPHRRRTIAAAAIGTGVRPHAACRRSNRSPPKPTSAPSWRPACRRNSPVRRFAARGPPIPQIRDFVGLAETTGTSTRRRHAGFRPARDDRRTAARCQRHGRAATSSRTKPAAGRRRIRGKRAQSAPPAIESASELGYRPTGCARREPDAPDRKMSL